MAAEVSPNTRWERRRRGEAGPPHGTMPDVTSSGFARLEHRRGECISADMAAHAKRKNSPRKAVRPRAGSRWSAHVTTTSDALDLEDGVFKKTNPKAVASSLKRSADRSRRRKADAFRSAMSMLNFFINRAGSSLSAQRRRVLERAKDELRDLYGRARRGEPTRGAVR